MFGWRGFGWRRWMTAQAVNDPDRAYFGRGPCGEYAYRLYKEGKMDKSVDWAPGSGQSLLLRELQEIRRRIEDLEKKIH